MKPQLDYGSFDENVINQSRSARMKHLKSKQMRRRNEAVSQSYQQPLNTSFINLKHQLNMNNRADDFDFNILD